jgi:hypothetical protein
VVFSTDASSYHGHPDPLTTPDGITRKSLALYYYTASRAIYDEVSNLGTEFQARTENEAKEVLLLNKNGPLLKDILPPMLYRNLRSIKKKYFGK